MLVKYTPIRYTPMRYTPIRHTLIRCMLARYTPIKYLFMRCMLMNLVLGALLPPVCGGHSALKPEMMDSSILASAKGAYTLSLEWSRVYYLRQVEIWKTLLGWELHKNRSHDSRLSRICHAEEE
jgi:hypothetical protein